MSLTNLPAPTVRTLPASLLSVDPRIQRDLVRRQLDSMSGDNYDPASLGTLIVSRRSNASYVILDGQHRWTIVNAQDADRELECRVYENLTFQQEAELFLAFNNQSSVNSIGKFRAGVVAGREGAVRIQEILDKYGLEVGAGQHKFSAVYSAMRIMTWRNGPALFDSTIDLLTAAWSPIHNDKQAPPELESRKGNMPYRGTLVEGVARLLHRYDSAVNRTRMIATLRAHGSRAPERIANDAAALKSAMAGLSAPEAIAQVIVRLYNQQHGGPRLPRWDLEATDNLGGAPILSTMGDLMNTAKIGGVDNEDIVVDDDDTDGNE